MASPRVGSLREPTSGAGGGLGWLAVPCKPLDEDVDENLVVVERASGSLQAHPCASMLQKEK